MDDVVIVAIGKAHRGLVPARRFRTETGLRRFVVRHADALLGVHVLATEFLISTNGGGRIDAVAIDRRGNPVIVEFKRSASGTAICQGLYYLDWLDRHRGTFSVIVMERRGDKAASNIDWSAPRLICLAEEIGEREEAVARQIGRTVDLLQIRRLPSGLVLIQRPRQDLHFDGRD